MLLPTIRRRTINTQKDTQFSDAWIVLAVLLTLAGLAFSNAFLTTAALLLLVVSGGSWLWSAVAHVGLLYQRRFSEIRAFQGETIELSLEVRNQKWIPLSWVNVRDLFPPELPITDVRASGIKLNVNPTSNLAEFNTFWMTGPFQRITRRFHVQCTIRGFHKFGPATVTTGDAFGFFSRRRALQDEQRLIVYPRLYSAEQLQLPTRNPFGDVRVTGSLFEDPLRTAGIREWHSSDTMRRIHWKASARVQQILSRVYEPSEEQVIQFFLNVATLRRHWHGFIPELLERTISVTASLAVLASEQRLSVGLIANGALPESDQPIRLLPGRSPAQLMHLLEMLAAVTPFASQTIELLLSQEAARMPWGATIVVVTAMAHDELLASIMELAAAGRRVVLFTLAEEPPRQWLHNVTVFHLPHLVDDLIVPHKIEYHDMSDLHQQSR